MTDTPTNAPVVTDAMIKAGEKAWMNRDLKDTNSNPLRDCYLAMSATAAPPSVDEVEAVVVEELVAEGRSGRSMYNSEQNDALDDEARAFYRKVIRRYVAAMSARSPVGWEDISTAPKDESWVLLYAPHFGDEPMVRLGFWGEGDDWFDSEAASHSLTAFGWQPIAWKPFEPPSADLLQKMAGIKS